LALRDEEAFAVSSAAANLVAPEDFGMVTEILGDGSDGGTQLALTVHAESIGGAIVATDRIWEQLRAAAGLIPSAAHLDFIVGPVDEAALRHDVILARARRLAGSEPTYAVVAAQTAFEVYVEGLFRDLCRTRMSLAVADAVQPRSFALRDASSQRLFAAVIGEPVQAAGPLWTRYGEHAKRRNGIVHAGAEVTGSEADESIGSVTELIGWIDTAVDRAPRS
jgi:hypothetical protein